MKIKFLTSFEKRAINKAVKQILRGDRGVVVAAAAAVVVVRRRRREWGSF